MQQQAVTVERVQLVTPATHRPAIHTIPSQVLLVNMVQCALCSNDLKMDIFIRAIANQVVL